MISELVQYYEDLLHNRPDEIPPYGWCTCKVSFVARISSKGELLAAIPLVDKAVTNKVVPSQEKRAVNIAANFLCDNSSYIFGIDAKGKPDRTAKCFEASRNLHMSVLDTVSSVCAKALRSYFENWQQNKATDNLVLLGAGDGLLAGGNIVFEIDDGVSILDPLNDCAIRKAWESRVYEDESADRMRCLATGEEAAIARLHPSIKGVYGAQSSGASLVSFNARAFESYGHDGEQGRNAPVSKQAAHAYTTALNYLLAHRDHHVRLGDTTIVYWSERKDQENCALMSLFLGGWSPDGTAGNALDSVIDATVKAIAKGEWRSVEGIDPDAKFYVLGLAPSAARLSVKYFFRNSFGDMLENLGRHYRRLEITHPKHARKYLTPYILLREIEQPKAKKPVVAPILNGPLLKAMLEDAPYPQALYDKCLLRIRATQENPDEHVHKVTRGRAAIIRAYLIRNFAAKGYDEKGLSVELNEDRNECAYGLGRAFAVLERIQEGANERVTITNRYFNAASTTPAAVYPLLLRLSVAHLAKMRRGDKAGFANYLEGILREAIGDDVVDALPVRLSNLEQGDFMLGYYHQREQFYKRKDDLTRDDEEE